jgi:hypothetical protein
VLQYSAAFSAMGAHCSKFCLCCLPSNTKSNLHHLLDHGELFLLFILSGPIKKQEKKTSFLSLSFSNLSFDF